MKFCRFVFVWPVTRSADIEIVCPLLVLPNDRFGIFVH
jgi:hypothetical protein